MARENFFAIFGDRLDEEKKKFIRKNYYSIDAIEFRRNKIILYEIKTRNLYKKKLPPQTKNNKITAKRYKEAKKPGFDVKLAIIRLFDNWNYAVVIKDLGEEKLCMDKPKKYDRKEK